MDTIITVIALFVIWQMLLREMSWSSSPASKDKDSSTFNESAGGADFGGPGDEKAEWKRQWSVVVRRDILRQQRAIVGGQKDVLTQLKRTGIACQKEIRKKALRGQRLASNPQIQV